MPEHLPIKVKIKREKEKLYRDLNNENWARDFEIEVKNTGTKPIYSLAFLLEVPDAKIADSYQAFTIVYGRTDLFDLNNSPGNDDVPIRPGETRTLALEQTGIKGWDQARGSGLVPRQIRGARLIFQRLSFGDGTGFDGTTGTPRSKPNKKPVAQACRPSSDRYGGSARRGSLADAGDVGNIASFVNAGIFQPASFFRDKAAPAALRLNSSNLRSTPNESIGRRPTPPKLASRAIAGIVFIWQLPVAASKLMPLETKYLDFGQGSSGQATGPRTNFKGHLRLPSCLVQQVYA
ncbi:MAG TPA: hypothetical protein VLN44_09480 [Pyrinomonadaceae bacterium]|nr:hypothetical protein [Pyrinomonadaceae bacterium]